MDKAPGVRLPSWPKLPMLAVMLIVTAAWLWVVWPQWFWAPVVALVVLLVIARKWQAVPLIALALLTVGLYASLRYGQWRLLGQPGAFWYSVLYTFAVLVMGVRVVARYWGRDRYLVLRTSFNVYAQLVLGFGAAFLVPEAFGGGSPETAGSGPLVMYLWPLQVEALLIGETASGALVKAFLAWNILAGLVVMPVLVHLYGRRVYCSWLCGVGCLAETYGDPFRTLTPRGRLSRALEPVIYLSTLAAVGLTVWALLASPEQTEQVRTALGQYHFAAKFVLASAIGVGLTSLLGARIWCRYFCPWAGLFGLIARFGRFSIRTRGDLCIGCGVCNAHCEMGIDVRGFAMRGEPVRTTTCVGCGMCIARCPRRVLSFGRD